VRGRQVRVAELDLDLVERHALPGELLRVGVAEPVEVDPLGEAGSAPEPRHQRADVAREER
jgi:hypothetical protein